MRVRSSVRTTVTSSRTGLGSWRGSFFRAVGPAISPIAESVEAMAESLVPVDTGRLRLSISWNFLAPSWGIYRTGFVVTANTPYALAVHERFDLTHAVGQPRFLSTAGRLHSQRFRAALVLAMQIATQTARIP